jgi:hypothetical protein
MRQSIEEWAGVNCPSIIDPLSGSVRPSPEALEAAALAAAARAGISSSPSRSRSGSGSGGGNSWETGNLAGGGGGAEDPSPVGSFLRGVLGAARSAVGYSRGDSSRYAPAAPAASGAAAASPADGAPATDETDQQRQQRQQRQQPSEAAGIMYGGGERTAEEEEVLRSFEELYRSQRRQGLALLTK